MARLAGYPGLCRYDLEHELNSPGARLLHGDYAPVPLNHSRRGHSDRPLTHIINEQGALDTPYTLRNRSYLGGAGDAALIDRDGPFGSSPYSPRYARPPRLYDDADYLDLPHPGWHFPHTYPLQRMESGGSSRWSLDQIHAYNRDVLRHNNQITRRRNVGVPDEYMMLHPMMDTHGRFPPGFDRPRAISEFLAMDEPLLDTHLHHYALPPPTHLSQLLLPQHPSTPSPSSLRALKQIQLLSFHGARRLAEHLALCLLAVQGLLSLPSLATSIPPTTRTPLGYGLGPDFDDGFISSGEWLREYTALVGGAAAAPLLQALGYGNGNGIAGWDLDVLARLKAAAGSPGMAGRRGWGALGELGLFPGTMDAPFPLPPGFGLLGGWGHGAAAAAAAEGAWGRGGSRGHCVPRRMSHMHAGGLGAYARLVEEIGCDGGARGRSGRFNGR